MWLVVNWGWNEHFAHFIPVEAHILQFLKFNYSAWVPNKVKKTHLAKKLIKFYLLFSFFGFCFLISVQFDISYCHSEWKWLMRYKEVVFISYMDVFYIIFDSSEQPCEKAKKGWLLKLLLLRSLRFWCVVTSWFTHVSLPGITFLFIFHHFFHLFQLLLSFLYFLSYSLPLLFAVLAIFKS